MLRKEGRRSVLSRACCCIFFLKLWSLPPPLGMGEKLTTSVSREWGETMSDYLHLVQPAEDGLFPEISSWPLPVLCEMGFSTFYSDLLGHSEPKCRYFIVEFHSAASWSGFPYSPVVMGSLKLFVTFSYVRMVLWTMISVCWGLNPFDMCCF